MDRGDAARVDLVKLAKAQQQLLYALGALALLTVGTIAVAVQLEDSRVAPFFVLVAMLGQLGMMLVALVLAVRMSRIAAIGWGSITLLCVVVFIPVLNIVTLAGVNSRVLALLRTRGVKIGLLGVPRKEMIRLIAGTCVCGYDLRGLQSAVCPECGASIAAAKTA